MKTVLYRLDITLPDIADEYSDDYDPTWVPPAWAQVDRELYERDCMRAAWTRGEHVPEDWEPDWGAYSPRPWPGWPSVRLYFSRSGAEARASLFRRYGAAVNVVASRPVTWPDSESPAVPRVLAPLRLIASA